MLNFGLKEREKFKLEEENLKEKKMEMVKENFEVKIKLKD
jgi:hypothetical protein